MKETKLFKLVTGTEMKPWLSRNMLPNVNTCENGWSNFSANLRVVSLKLLQSTQFVWPNLSIYFNFLCAVPRDDVIESTRFLMRPPVNHSTMVGTVRLRFTPRSECRDSLRASRRGFTIIVTPTYPTWEVKLIPRLDPNRFFKGMTASLYSQILVLKCVSIHGPNYEKYKSSVRLSAIVVQYLRYARNWKSPTYVNDMFVNNIPEYIFGFPHFFFFQILARLMDEQFHKKIILVLFKWKRNLCGKGFAKWK